VCYGVLMVWCNVVQCVAKDCQAEALTCSSVLQCVAVCCSVSQCVALRCSVLQCVLLSVAVWYSMLPKTAKQKLLPVVVCCGVLQCIVV